MKFKRVLAFLLAVVLSLSCAGDFGMLTAYAAEDVSASAHGSVDLVEPVLSETAEELTELFEETSVEPVSAEEALAAEIPAEEAPAEELSVVEEAPVVETPVVETPAEEPEVILPAYAYESYTGLAPIDDFYTELYVDLEGWLPTDAFVWFEGAEFSDLNENDIPLYIWRVHVCGPQAVDYEPEPGETVNVTLRGETVARMLREGWDLRVRVLREYQDERDAIEVETTVTWDNALSFDVPSFFRWVIYRHTEPAAAETPVAEKAPVLSGLQAAPAAVPSLTGTGAPAASLNAAPAVSDSGSDYVFPAATVALSDVLSAVGITLRQNNYSVSVDSPAVSLSGNRVNRNGLGSFTLTAQASFTRATLSLTSTNGKDSHTVTLSYPVPVEEPEDGLVEFVPENAIWGNDDLYLTGKMPGNAVVVATPVTVGIAGEQVLAAYDIKIYPNRNQVGKKEWNPKQQQSKVQVHFFEDAFADQDLMVYHLADAQSEPEYVATVRAEDGWISFEAESFSVYAVTSVIEKTVEIGGSTYRVSVVYDSTARIPEGTELNVSELGQDAYLADAEQALHVGEDDTVYYTKFLDIALVHNGEAVEPQAPVQVTVELLDADEAAELGLQVVHFGLGGAEAVASSLNGDGAVTFETESFSPFGFTSILSTLMSWTDDLFSFSLLGVSSLFSPRYTPAALPTLEEGLEALEAYTVSSTGLLGSLTGLFVKISRSAALALGTLESVTVYGLKDGAAGAVLTEDLGTEAQTLSLSGAGGFVMVRDTGYRRFNFELDNVTLNGMMPKASEAVAADVGEAYAVFTPEDEDAFEALAAYDISISSGGEEYQPDAEHPVAVSIALPDEAQDLAPEALEVWHVRDDGTKERVEDITVENGRVRFEATGFSVYVIIDHEGGTVVTPRVEFHFIAPLSGDAENGSLVGSVYQYTSEPYSFLNKHNEQQHTQILKGGEGLELIQNPPNKSNPDRYFFGWYIVNPVNVSGDAITYTWTKDPVQVPFETAISISPATGLAIGDSVTWTMGSASGSGIVDADGNAHVYLAPIYEDYYFVNFHLGPKEDVGTDSNPGLARSLMTRKLIVLGTDGRADIRIGNIQAESPDAVHKIFVGWETVHSQGGTLATDEEYITLDAAGNEINHPAGKTGYYITVNREENIDLYPVFAEARWLYFNTGKAGNGATYVGAQYLLTSDDEVNSTYYYETLPISARNGFEFKGWYLSQDADENGTGDCITNLSTINTTSKTIGLVNSYTKYDTNGTTKLWEIVDGKLYFYKAMDDLTLYARWEEVANTTYSVIVWKQKVTNAVNAATKTYDYVAADSQMNIPGISGQTLQDLIDANALAPFITTGSNAKYTGFSYARTTMTTETVAGDRTTVVNVYYDRDVHTFTFQVQNGWNSSTSGSYGLVSGQYVRLYQSGNNFYYLTLNGNPYTGTPYIYYDSDTHNLQFTYGGNKNNRARGIYNGSYYTLVGESDGRLYSLRWYQYSGGTRYTPRYDTISTITALYGQNIVDNFNNPPFSTTYNGYIWTDVNRVLYSVVLSAPSLEVMREADVLFRGGRAGTTKHMLYYLETLAGDPASDAATDIRTFNEKTFYFYKSIAHEYPYVTLTEDFTPVEGFNNDPTWSDPQLQYGQTPNGQYDYYRTVSGDNYFYYTRKVNSLIFDVNYPNLTGLDYSAGTSTNLTVSDIPYGQSLTQYGKVDDEWYYGTGENPTNRLYGPAHYTFEGWYEDPAGTVAFDFSQTMPSGDKIVYAKWTPVTFRVHFNPNGAVIDHSDQSAWSSGTAHYTDKATYINADYGVAITEYTLTREYVPISDSVAANMSENDVYYYMYAKYFENTGRGLPADLRNALYLTESQLQTYYDYYVATIRAKKAEDPDRYNEVTELGYNGWKNDYVSTQKYRRAYANENYVFLGWYKNDEAMPYNFSDPVTGSFTLTARWRLDGGYYIQYIPEYRTGSGVLINGDMERWRDPAQGATYADQAHTTTLQQPTGLTADGNSVEEGTYNFLGWRIVDVAETLDGEGHVTNVTYTPMERDENGDVVYHRESEDFLIEAKYADSNGRICLQAVYEEKNSSVRRPEIANLTLDANTGFITTDGENELNTSMNLSTIGDVGTVLLDVDEGREQIVFGDIQSNIAVHLDDYAVTPNYFKHPDGFFLLGFDVVSNPLNIVKLNPQTGVSTSEAQPYVPNYPADSVIAVQRTDDELLYAIWEPMVYLTIVNDTGVGPVTFSLSDNDNGALYVVNVKDGLYDRTPLNNLGRITVADGEELVLAIPQGAEKEISIKGANTLGTGKVLEWNTSLDLVVGSTTQRYDTAEAGSTDSYSHTAGTTHSHSLAHGEKNNTQSFSFDETLIVNENPLVVTFTSRDNAYALLLDDNYPAASGLTGSISERDYASDQVMTNAAPVGAKTDDVPSANTCLGYTFKGWAYTADATEPVYKTGNWVITDLEQFFEVGQTRQYTTETEGGTIVRTLYAVWEINQKSNTVYVYKDVPAPGNQEQSFRFDVSISASYRKNISDYNFSQSGSFYLKNNQYAAVYTSQSTSYPVNVTTTVKIYNVSDDSRVFPTNGDDPDYTFTATTSAAGDGSFNDINISVTEEDAASYTTTIRRISEGHGSITLTGTELNDNPLTVTGREISWTRTEQTGTVIYTNARQTAHVTVKKTLVGETGGSFRYTGSYTADGKTTTLEPFNVEAGGAVTLRDIPVGAVLTLTEAASDDYIVTTAFEKGSSDTNGDAKAVAFSVPNGGETVTYTNTLKSYPVKLVKVDQAGNGGVEARFNLTRGSSAIFSGKYTTPTDNVIYDANLYVGTYVLTETWVQTGYIGLDAPVTLSLGGSGTLTTDNPHAVVSGDADHGFVVTVYNQATVDVQIRKVLNDPLTTRAFAFQVSYTYTLNGEQVTESPVVPPVNSGSSTTVSVPVGATLTVTEADTYNAYTNYDTASAMTDADGVNVADTDSDAHVFTAVVTKAGTLTFTNTRKTVNVTVIKAVVDPLYIGDPFSFTATLKNGANTIGYDQSGFTDGVYASAISLANGESRTFTVPVGATLILAETVNASLYTTTSAVTSGTVAVFSDSGSGFSLTVPGAASAVTVTNTRKTGSLEVSKTVESDLTADKDTEFDFTVTLGNTVSGTYGSMTFTNGVASFKLKHGETKTATGLPVGMTYSVTEAADENFTSVSTGSTGTIRETLSEADFTNTRKTADLSVSKTVTGAMGDTSAANTFVFTLTVTGAAPDTQYTYTGTGIPGGTLTLDDSSQATFPLAHGQTITIKGLPQKSTITVTESHRNYIPTWDVSDANLLSLASVTDGYSFRLSGNAAVTVTNDLPAVAPTGLSFREAPYVWLLGIGAVLVWSAVLLPKKKKEED